MISKGITILAQTGILNDDIHEWRRQTMDQKTWAKYKLFFHRDHLEQIRAVKTAGKGGYTVTVKNVYGAPPQPLEDHNEAIEEIQIIV